MHHTQVEGITFSYNIVIQFLSSRVKHSSVNAPMSRRCGPHWWIHMVSGIDIYSQLLISTIRISDIIIWNYWYHYFELLISAIQLLISTIRIADINNLLLYLFELAIDLSLIPNVDPYRKVLQ